MEFDRRLASELERSTGRREALKLLGKAGLVAATLPIIGAGRREAVASSDSDAPSSIELPYRAELFESRNYPYAIMRPVEWDAIEVAAEDGMKNDKLISSVAASDGIITNVELFSRGSIPGYTLEDYLEIVKGEVKDKNGEKLTYTKQKLDNSTIDAFEIAAVMPGEKPTLPPYEQRTFVFLTDYDVWTAKAKYTTDEAMNKQEYTTFWNMMVHSFHITNS